LNESCQIKGERFAQGPERLQPAADGVVGDCQRPSPHGRHHFSSDAALERIGITYAFRVCLQNGVTVSVPVSPQLLTISRPKGKKEMKR